MVASRLWLMAPVKEDFNSNLDLGFIGNDVIYR